MTGLMPRFLYGSLDLTDYPFLVQFGSDLGAPETAFEVLATLMQDGDVEISDRAGNRTITIPVLIEGTDLGELAAAEAMLQVEAQKSRNQLVIDPGDGYGAPTLFKTFAGTFSLNRDDRREIAGYRAYDLTIRAEPFGFSVNEVVAAALEDPTVAIPVETVVINDASSPTGWARTGDPYSAMGAYGSQVTNAGQQYRTDLHLITLDGTVSTATTKFITVDYLTGSQNPFRSSDLALHVGDGSISIPLTAITPSPFTGYLRASFRVPDTTASVTKLWFSVAIEVGSPNQWLESKPTYFAVTQVGRTNAAPTVGTARQKLRTVPVPGTERTPGSLVISHPTSALGDVLAFTWRTDRCPEYLPALRSRRIAGGGAVVDAAMVSGARDPIDTVWKAEVPSSQVPEGEGQFMARLFTGAPATIDIDWAVITFVGGAEVSRVGGTTRVVFAGGWQNVTLCFEQFLNTDVKPGAPAVTQFHILRQASATMVLLDEAWYFNTDRELGVSGALSQVSLGVATPAPGGSSSVLSIETASVERPFPAYFRGTKIDGSDWFSANAAAVGLPTHEFIPSSMRLLTVTSNALDASSTIRCRPAFHTHATQ